jgi:hypothetical protein
VAGDAVKDLQASNRQIIPAGSSGLIHRRTGRDGLFTIP